VGLPREEAVQKEEAREGLEVYGEIGGEPAPRGQPVEVHGEEVNEEEPQPEDGHGHPHQGEGHGEGVPQGVPPHGGKDADGDPQEDGEGGGGQGQLKGGGPAPLQLLGHGDGGDGARAQVAPEDVAQEGEVLDVKGLVEAQLFPELGDLLRRGPLAEKGLGGVPGDELEEEEDQKGDPQQDGDEAQKPF